MTEKPPYDMAPAEEFVLHCDTPDCEASLSMVSGVPRSEHGWGRMSVYLDGGIRDYDLCTEHWKQLKQHIQLVD